MKTPLVSTPVFVLCFVSLISACFGGIGLIFSVTGLYIAHQKIRQAQQNPLGFTGSLSTMKLAKIAVLISLIVNLLYFIFSIIWIYENSFQEFQDRWLNMLFLR